MSNTQHLDAILPGYDGPFFTPSLDGLHEQHDRAGIRNGIWLQIVGGRIDGYDRFERVTTSDHYFWFWGLVFRRGAGEVIVLIPWGQDRDQHDGTKRDRSIAVHTRNVDEATADEVVSELAFAVRYSLAAEA